MSLLHIKSLPNPFLTKIIGNKLNDYMRWLLKHSVIRHLHIFHNTPCLPPKYFALPLFFFISPGYYSRPKRNKTQCLWKTLGVKHGVLREMTEPQLARGRRGKGAAAPPPPSWTSYARHNKSVQGFVFLGSVILIMVTCNCLPLS